jgi:IclR family transcriptional regulator, pca regulon regulatory protein
VHESSSLSVLDGHDIVYVARVPTSRIMTVAINVGTRFPAYATSMGRVLLAGLDDEALEQHLSTLELERFTSHTVATVDDLRARVLEARHLGHALVDQELEHGLRSLAVPVRDPAGRVVAAVNVSSHISRITRERARRDLLPPLLRAAGEIEADLIRTGRQT